LQQQIDYNHIVEFINLLSCVFFFFQAEDGIRALYVTGVQTCALPILQKNSMSIVPFFAAVAWATMMFGCGSTNKLHQASLPELRSEERRVGKGGRARREADQ